MHKHKIKTHKKYNLYLIIAIIIASFLFALWIIKFDTNKQTNNIQAGSINPNPGNPTSTPAVEIPKQGEQIPD